jgi:hypothetical protein
MGAFLIDSGLDLIVLAGKVFSQIFCGRSMFAVDVDGMEKDLPRQTGWTKQNLATNLNVFFSNDD